jgi:hypothetical protein
MILQQSKNVQVHPLGAGVAPSRFVRSCVVVVTMRTIQQPSFRSVYGEGDREGRIQSTHPQRTFQLNAKSRMTSYPGSALGIQIPPQNQVPKRPYFEMRSAGAIKTLPRVSQTDLTSFFRTDRSTHGCAAVTQSSETITSYARLRFSYNRTNSKAKIMPEMTALLKSLIRCVEEDHGVQSSISRAANIPPASKTLKNMRLRVKPANSGVTRYVLFMAAIFLHQNSGKFQ